MADIEVQLENTSAPEIDLQVEKSPYVTCGGIAQFDGVAQFPTTGRSDVLFVDASANLAYRWDATDMQYYLVCGNLMKISLIEGGNADD